MLKLAIMMVSVYLHTILGRPTPDGIQRRLEVDLPPGSTMGDLLQQLQVSLAPDQILLVVNGIMTDESQALMDGDQVNLMPSMSGGAMSGGVLHGSGYSFPKSA